MRKVAVDELAVDRWHPNTDEMRKIAREADVVLGTKYLNPMPLFNKEQLQDVRPRVMTYLLSRYWFSDTVMTAIRSVLNSVLNSEDLLKNVHQWLRIRKRVSGSSVFGVVYMALIDGVQESRLAVKLAKKGNLVHEAVVGAIMNRLRPHCLNFNYFFTTFGCSPAVDDNPRLGWCVPVSSEKSGSYLVNEFIDGITVTQWLREQPPLEDFHRLMIHLIFALWIAGTKVGFTHFDLHTDNVMIRELNETIEFTYEIEPRRRYYVQNNRVPIVIDFGQSRVEYEGAIFFYPNVPNNFDSFRYFPAFDLMRFIYSALFITTGPIFKYLVYLLGYFVDDVATLVSRARAREIDMLRPPYQPLESFSHRDFIAYINQLYPIKDFVSQIPDEDAKVFRCCLDEDTVETFILNGRMIDYATVVKNLLDDMVVEDLDWEIRDNAVLTIRRTLQQQLERVNEVIADRTKSMLIN